MSTNRPILPTNRVAKLRALRTDALEKPDTLTKSASASLSEAYDRLASEPDSIRFIIGAMQPLGPRITTIAYEQANRVRAQLEQYLPGAGISVEFDYQGSATNNTHIKAFSDIDLLVLRTEFYSLEPPQIASNPYRGEPLTDLLALRRAARAIISKQFPEVEIKGRTYALSLSGGSLRRKVDLVPANWYDSCAYSKTQHKAYRGVHVLDSDNRKRVINYPFLHNALLDKRDHDVNGNLRKVIRLLKSIKYTENIRISSYDICSIAYAMPNRVFEHLHGFELQMTLGVFNHLASLVQNKTDCLALMVPNRTRLVFCAEGATVVGLCELATELGKLLVEAASSAVYTSDIFDAYIPY